ncbi:MAG: D-alanyl-D-alanine carboxypeptidase [Desulfobacterales bacterium]
MLRKVSVLTAYVCLSICIQVLPTAVLDARGGAADRRDACLLIAPDGRVLWSHRADRPMVPASTQKIVTALAALHYLGEDFVYETHLYREDRDLRVKGLGDPLLVSEALERMATQASEHIGEVRHVLLDDTYFESPLTIPGVSSSTNPYDAPNGALCVNFNTVYFKRVRNGFASAEPQTPLLPMVMDRIRRSGLSEGRIVLSRENGETLLYAGRLLEYFLKNRGVEITGEVRVARTPVRAVDPDLRFQSPYVLTDVLGRLLAHSNNYIANQLIVSCGIQRFGPPGTLEKGVLALNEYAAGVLGLEGAVLVEGSGISRENRLSAVHLVKALNAFAPHRPLMSRKGNEWYKTGHLNGVRTRAGYIEGADGSVYSFAVLVNSPGRSTHDMMKRVHRIVARDEKG